MPQGGVPAPGRGASAGPAGTPSSRGPEHATEAGAGDHAAELAARLHAHGLRVTHQRELVLDAVEALGHGTPEEICDRVQAEAPHVNLSTVYRALDALESVGLVRHAHLGTGPPIYHAAREHAHLHLVCLDCGRVIEADIGLARELVGRLEAQLGFTTDVEHMAFSGHCADCVAAARGRTR